MKAKAKITINGISSDSPVEFKATEVLATFDKEAIQPSISIDKYTFVGNEYTLLKNYIDSGKIFDCPSILIELFNEDNTKNIFDGMIDLTNDVEIDEFAKKIKAKLVTNSDLLSLNDQLSALSFGYLEYLGKIKSSDYSSIDYIVQKKFNVLETIIAALLTYMLAKELAEAAQKIGKDTANISAHIAGGLTGAVAGVIYATAILILDAIYTALIFAALIKAASTLLNQLIPIKRKAKCLNYRRAMTIVASHLNLTFESNISDLDVCYYLPANFNQDLTNVEGVISDFIGVKKGLPQVGEPGYNCADFFEMVRKQFNGKYAIIGDRLCFYNTYDQFWRKLSTFKMPSVRNKIKRYNTTELVANRLFSFDVDYTDEWTISQYQGTSYEIITDAINRTENTQIIGLAEVRFGIALAHSKTKDTGFDNLLKDVAKMIDRFTGSNLSAKIKGTAGLMIIGVNNYEKPKSIKFTNGRLVPRAQWSAKYIYETYYKGSSFIQTINSQPFYGQKEVYNDVRIGFGLNDFMTLINCSEITDEQGRKGRVESLKFNIDGSFATVNYYVRQPYSTELKEIYIEPTNIDI